MKDATCVWAGMLLGPFVAASLSVVVLKKDLTDAKVSAASAAIANTLGQTFSNINARIAAVESWRTDINDLATWVNVLGYKMDLVERTQYRANQLTNEALQSHSHHIAATNDIGYVARLSEVYTPSDCDWSIHRRDGETVLTVRANGRLLFSRTNQEATIKIDDKGITLW